MLDAVLVGFVIVSILALGGLAYFSNPRSKANKFFASTVLWLAIWATSNFLEGEVRTPAIASLLLRLDFTSAALLAYFFLLFCLNFPVPAVLGKAKEYIAFIPIALLALLSFSSLIIKDIGPYRGGFQLQFGRGPLFWAYALCIFGYITAGNINLFFKWNKSRGIRKVQVSYILLGILLAASPALFINLIISQIIILPVTLSRLGIYGILFFVGFGTYAIVTYRLMDVRVAITRGTVFAAVYAFVLGIPVVIGFWGKTYLSHKIGGNWWLIPVGITLILATLGPTTFTVLRRRTERKRQRYQENLIALAKQMTLTKDLRQLLVLIIHRVTKEIGISHARIYLLDKKADQYVREVHYGKERRRQFGDSLSKDAPLIQMLYRSRDIGPLLGEEIISHFETSEPEYLEEVKAQLRSMGASLLLPAFIGDELVAFLSLGTKRSKEIYTPDDLNMFKILSGQAALAIENAQFYQELKESQAAMFQAAKLSSIGELAAGFAHQIDNPLAIISCEAELCIRDLKDLLGKENLSEEEKKKILEAIKHRQAAIMEMVQRGAKLVWRIKDYAKPSDKDFEATGLNTVIDDALSLAQYQISHGAINVTKEIPEDLPRIRGIGVQLQQAFLNMIINACEAMAGKKGELAISARVANENPSIVEVVLADNGRGITKENMKKVFDIFFTTKGPQGTGMGLTLAYRIIKDHGGDIAVESEVGKGTTFTISLPIWQEKS